MEQPRNDILVQLFHQPNKTLKKQCRVQKEKRKKKIESFFKDKMIKRKKIISERAFRSCSCVSMVFLVSSGSSFEVIRSEKRYPLLPFKKLSFD